MISFLQKQKKLREETKMKLEAIVEHSRDEKYIVAQVTNGEKQTNVLVSLPFNYHSSIAKVYRQRLPPNSQMEVLGGGILDINRQNKTIETYGTSGSFGAPPIELVREILTESFPDYTIDARVTNYIR
jgi:hypothetical protein